MKNHRIRFLLAASFAFTALTNVGCAEKKVAAVATLPTAEALAAAKPAASPDPSTTKWADIKEIAFDLRAQFFAGLKIVEARVDAQVTELTARRGAMTSSTDTKDWDFAMKEMVESRAYLKSTGEALTKASYETWTQEKDKVGAAWERTQAAYAKVKSSTTG